MVLRSIIVFAAVFSAVAFADAATECAKGPHTTLECTSADTPIMPRHDQSLGRTRFVVRSAPHGEVIGSKEFEGQWFCFGYSANAHAYIIGGVYQIGAWLPLGSIQYLSEDGNSSKPSAFDRKGYNALSSVSSPANRFIVFIGGKLTSGELFVLDMERDIVRKLGTAPLPPPNQGLDVICHDEPFEWGSCWAERYLDMDDGIFRFTSETELEVSYGKDGPLSRATKRRIRKFRLDK